MCDFVNPESLGSYQVFKNVFAKKIQAAQEKGASKKEREEAAELNKEIQFITSKFILRRTKDVLNLPPKRMTFFFFNIFFIIILIIIYFFFL